MTEPIDSYHYHHLIWQAWSDDYGQEQPVLVSYHKNSGNLSLNQDGKAVLVQSSSIPELIKLLREIEKRAKEDADA